MLRHAIILAALATTPALAQEKVDLLATTVAGVTDGSTAAVSQTASGPVARVAAGSYTITTGEGVSTLVVTEPEECLFEVTFGSAGAPSGLIRFDFNLVSGVEYTAAEEMQGLNQFLIALAGEGDLVQFATPGGEYGTVAAQSNMATSLALADIEAAATALEAACPKP